MKDTVSNILCIGAHPDDIELSCAGSLLKFKSLYKCKIHYVICSNGELKTDGKARELEQKKVCKKLGVSSVKFLELPDANLHLHLNDLIREVEIVSHKIDPELVFTHTNLDYHQDHLAVHQATIIAFRNKNSAIVLYPSAYYRKSLEVNFVVDITDYFTEKQEILDLFKSQRSNWYLTPKYVSNLAISMGGKFGEGI